jgi:hypothetical protein
VVLCRAFLENAEFHFESGDALTSRAGWKASLACGNFHAITLWHPAVAVTQQHDKEGSTALDLGKADFEDKQLVLLLGPHLAEFNALSEINPFEVISAFMQFLL